jgi:hypothetical protein
VRIAVAIHELPERMSPFDLLIQCPPAKPSGLKPAYRGICPYMQGAGFCKNQKAGLAKMKVSRNPD